MVDKTMSHQADTYLQSGSNELKILEFTAGNEVYGINILKVSRVLSEMEAFTVMPEMHPAVRGVFTDHGQVVPVLDLGFFLGGVQTSLEDHYRIIITEFFGAKNALLVNNVEAVHTLLWEKVINAQTVMDKTINPYVISIVRPHEDKMIFLLDYETIILKLTPGQYSDQIKRSGEAAFNGNNLTVLIAEDSSSVRDMLQLELEDHGFRVLAAHDGREAFDMISANKEIALVISDVEMPRMDGLALTKQIKDDPNTASIPVIVYSSIGDLGMKERAKFLRAEEHITKLNLNELFTKVCSLLHLE